MATIVDRMIKNYENFTKSERKIVDYILTNRNDAQYLSITDLSNACDISVSTVSLFCRKLDMDGFNAFKLELAKATMPQTNIPYAAAYGNVLPDDTTKQVLEKIYNDHLTALKKTYMHLKEESITAAVDCLMSARRVLCLGQGNHAMVAKSAWAKFSTVTDNFFTMDDSHLQTLAVSTLCAKDVVLFFSYSGSTHDLLELANLIKVTGAKLILVTRYPNSPGGELADVTLQIGIDERPQSYGSLAAMTAQIFIIDLLYNEYCRRDHERCDDVRDFVGKALAKKCL